MANNYYSICLKIFGPVISYLAFAPLGFET